MKRKDLIKVLADNLPPGTVRFGSPIVSVNMDRETSYPTLQLYGEKSIRAKVRQNLSEFCFYLNIILHSIVTNTCDATCPLLVLFDLSN